MLSVEIKKLSHANGLPLPSYGSENCSGLDLYAAINKKKKIKNGEIFIVPTGIKIALKKNLEAQVRPRSGLAAKFGITVLNTPGTIDADYRGEIKIILINLGKKIFIIERGMRVAQLVITKVEKIKWNEKKKFNKQTKRKNAGFGSTGL
ncbi:MAG: Deoxyuridine 5'-triphosphate nucleotidohydrolase [Alphaproteobacteria bacterium MarineAlpha6_Bin5]|nr:MAG: Deoxyuridine 5'-triphosphate nucleotidohydrolase [Alphaproteobacteria bacterium MarineAlpha6_Bin5]|tara:strand:+ start:17391 stop:17837 length:447 start_codon:yes stop_codon:yes gene_type:complete